MAEGELQMQAQWTMNPLDVPLTANQMLLQLSMPTQSTGKPDGVYVAFGHVNPPVLDISDPTQVEALKNNPLPVVQIARLFVSRERLESFRDAMTAFLDTTASQFEQ